MSWSQAQRIFTEYLEQVGTGEAPTFEAVCTQHPELGEELREMHAAWQNSRERDPVFEKLKRHMGDDVDPGISLDQEPDEDVEPGSTAILLDKVAKMTGASRYSIKGEVARGGMGLIYKVWDRDLRRTLAMKVVLGKDGLNADGSTGGLDRDRLSRFLEEAQITGQLDHPGIVPVHELGLDSEGRVYFTMRLVRGVELREILDQLHRGEGTWTLTRTVQIVQRICESMAFAHEKGVVHRDLKPANVMVGRFGEVYVMDWGLAKVVGRDEPEAPEPKLDWTLSVVGTDRSGGGDGVETMEGSVFGTPCYMAPEQARGQRDRVGVRSDIYSLGSILYHLLTGTRPFVPEGEHVHPHAVLAQLLAGPPKPIHEFGASIPDELAAICEKAMQREPEDRYAGTLEMGEDLQAFLEGRVVRAHRTGAVAEFRKWVKRNRGMAAALLGLVIVTIGGSWGFAWQQKELAGTIRAEQRATLDAMAVAEANARRATRQSYSANLKAADVSSRTNEIREANRRLDACPEELRGWEWRHIAARADNSVATLPHGDAVFCIAADDRFERVATGSGDYAIRIWDTVTNKLVSQLLGHSGSVVAIDFDAAGGRLVSGAEDGTVRVWDVASGANLLSLRGHETTVSSVHFDAEDARIVSGGLDNVVRIWDADTGRELHAIDTGDEPVEAVAFEPGGDRVAAGLRDGTVGLWSTVDGTMELAIEAHRAAVTAIAYAADGSRLATSSMDGDVAVWSAAGQELQRVPGNDPVFCLALDSRGEVLVSGSADKSLRVTDVATGLLRAALNGHESPARAVALSADGLRAASASADGTARLWAAEVVGAVTTLSIGDEPAAAVATSPDGRRIAASSLVTGDIRVWDAPSGALLLEIPGRDDGVNALAFGPGGEWLAAGLDDSMSILLFDARTGKPRGSPLAGHQASIADLAVAADGETIASASADHSVRLWSVTAGTELRRLEGHAAPVTSVAFAPGATRVAAGAADGSLRVWDATSGATAFEIEAHDAAVQAVAFAPTGGTFATASLDGSLRVWDAETGERQFELSGHDGAIHSIAYDPDGERLVSGSFDRTLVVWDVESGESLLSLRGQLGPVSAVAFGPRGARVVSGAFDGRVMIWETATSAERFLSRTAAALVEDRLAQLGRMSQVIASIEGDERLEGALRSEALAIAANHSGATQQ